MAKKKSDLKKSHSKLKPADINKNKTPGTKPNAPFENNSIIPNTVVSKTAILTATFKNTIPGRSSLVARSGSQPGQTSEPIDRSGTITMTNLKSGQEIALKGNSLGSTTVTIDIDADPKQLDFEPGKINGSFFIL